MKFKNKGRKIYKTKEKNYYGKSPVGKAFSVGLTVLLIGGIGFIGYSVAEPLINYSKKKGDNADSSAVLSATESITDENGEPVEDNTEPAVPLPLDAEKYRAYALSTNDLIGTDTLKDALKRIPQGESIEFVEVPLKVGGGDIYYASNNYYATSAGLVRSYIRLKDIVSTISDAGYKPVALVSTFNDNTLPKYFRDMSYITVDDGSQWIDNTVEAGGKPWMNPFSETAVSYNSDIVEEISSAGFDKVVCYDFIFPDFRPSDAEYLGTGKGRAATAVSSCLHGIVRNKTNIQNY